MLPSVLKKKHDSERVEVLELCVFYVTSIFRLIVVFYKCSERDFISTSYKTITFRSVAVFLFSIFFCVSATLSFVP